MVRDSENIGIISDIHGNVWALEAVLEDISHRGIERIVNLGDSFYGPLDPAGTARRLLPLDFPTVRGNGDRAIVEARDDAPVTVRYTRDALAPEHVAWLRTLPTTIFLEKVLFCHGTPHSDETYLLEDVTAQGVSLASGTTIECRLGGVTAAVIACGHSHIPRTVLLPNRRLVINVGSVGDPCYTDESPLPHVMESASPHAKYAILSPCNGRWYVEHVLVPYEWERAAQAARRRGRLDWAEWIERGRVEMSLP
jgi:predicted phosphodiesterase